MIDYIHDRYGVIAIQFTGAEYPDYIIKDMITGTRIGPWFEAPEDAGFWLDLNRPKEKV